MSLALLVTDRDLSLLTKGLKARLPDVELQVWPHIHKPETVKMAVLWKQAAHSLLPMTNLSGVMSLGAGVDGIINDSTIAKDLPVSRIVDTDLNAQMAEYVLATIYSVKCQLATYLTQQQNKQWLEHARMRANNVLVLGLGSIGQYVADRLQNSGLTVRGWNRSGKSLATIACFSGKPALKEQLSWADYVVGLLPLTAQTHELYDASFFAKMKNTAYFINVGRAGSVNEAALINALNSSALAGAYVDVFDHEPLPINNPLWQTENLYITPHIAAVTNQQAIIEQVAQNYLRVSNQQPMHNLIDPQWGY